MYKVRYATRRHVADDHATGASRAHRAKESWEKVAGTLWINTENFFVTQYFVPFVAMPTIFCNESET